MFCQKDIRDAKLSCPADSKRTDVGTGYITLSETIEGFTKVGHLPGDIKSKVQYWDEGDGIAATLKRRRACWHIKCKNKTLHVTKLTRLQKCDNEQSVIADHNV